MAIDPATNDQSLVELALQGDGRAWSTLVERYGQLVWSIGRRSGLSAADADDLVQSVFTIMVGRLGELRDRDRLAGWLAVTARREAWRQAERARRERPMDPGVMPEGAEDPDESDELLLRRQAVREAMHRLGTRCRDLLLRAFGTSQVPSYEELAEALGLKLNSVGPTRRRCLEELLEHLRGDSEGVFAESR